jgi:membrane-bound lytic murein transglycosylase D
VRAKDYELKVPEGAADMVREQLAQANPDELASLNWHTVRKGETLLTISKKLQVSRADLAEANYLSAKAKVSVGQQLIIPRAPALLLASRTDNPAPPALAEAPVTESHAVDVVTASNAPRAEKTAQATLFYRVKRGDTLLSIAKLYRTTVSSLKTWNRLRGNEIKIGQRLTILRTAIPTATN